MQNVRSNVQGTSCKMVCKMQCVNGSVSQTSSTDQLDGPALQTSWMDQFFLCEALASPHIRRFFFKFVHCRSFQVWRRPCLVHESESLCVFLCKMIIIVIKLQHKWKKSGKWHILTRNLVSGKLTKGFEIKNLKFAGKAGWISLSMSWT